MEEKYFIIMAISLSKTPVTLVEKYIGKQTVVSSTDIEKLPSAYEIQGSVDGKTIGFRFINRGTFINNGEIRLKEGATVKVVQPSAVEEE